MQLPLWQVDELTVTGTTGSRQSSLPPLCIYVCLDRYRRTDKVDAVPCSATYFSKEPAIKQGNATMAGLLTGTVAETCDGRSDSANKDVFGHTRVINQQQPCMNVKISPFTLTVSDVFV